LFGYLEWDKNGVWDGDKMSSYPTNPYPMGRVGYGRETIDRERHL
jgi:hypothetical protein